MTQASLLDLIDGDPTHASDKAAVITAVREAARAHNNLISANDWRQLLPPWVFHKIVGATICGLISRRVLTPEGPPVRSTDTAGRNSGRWVPQYRYHGERLGEE